jgi:hypothetical protein
VAGVEDKLSPTFAATPMSTSGARLRGGIMINRVIVSVFAVVGLSLAQAAAGEDVCLQFKSDVEGKIFVAKVPLYDTKVTTSGIKHLERDSEEVPKGREFSVFRVICTERRIQMTILEEGVYKPRMNEVYLLLHKRDRVVDGAAETLKKITNHIYNEPEDI